jgi:5'(3')-deoxyribonucleotidase
MSDQKYDGMPILGVDLDGVCADFYGHMRTIAAEWMEKEISELPEDFTWGLREWIGDKDYDSLHRFAVTRRNLFRDAPLMKGARRYLRQLSDERFRIRLITHRLVIQHFHDRAVLQTMEWLDHHDIPFWDLCFMRHKGQVGADIYIEDSPGHVENLRNAGCYVICFGNSTNTHIGAPRAESWEQVYNFVKARTAELESKEPAVAP